MRWIVGVFLLQAYCYGGSLLDGHDQLLVVKSEGWESSHGTMALYERDGSQWIQNGETVLAGLGGAGLGWGIGLHPLTEEMIPRKIEGDKKSPAGLFSLGPLFGFLPKTAVKDLRMPYLPLSDSIEAVDDSSSLYYNQIVDAKEVKIDWASSEKMGKEPLYFWGAVIEHNFPHPQPEKGSAIFLHIWRKEKAPTLGCTSLSEENLIRLLYWLEEAKHPVIVQLPSFVYDSLKEEWGLP